MSNDRAAALTHILIGEHRLRQATAAHDSNPNPDTHLGMLVAVAWLAADLARVATLHTPDDPVHDNAARKSRILYDRVTNEGGPAEQNILNTAHALRRAHRNACTIPTPRSAVPV